MSRSTIPAKRGADAQEAAWVADEDRFVLQQARKKSAIRAKNGRAQPIDWLTVILAVIDPERNPLDDEVEVGDLEVKDPEAVFDALDTAELADLEKKIDTLQVLESSKSNRDFWSMMKAVCRDKQTSSRTTSNTSVKTDLDRLLGPKTLPELEKLEKQVKNKLASNEPIDTDYWENLLKSLLTYKARAKLRSISKSILEARLGGLRQQQILEAAAMKQRLASRYSQQPTGLELDPEPLLRVRPEDKILRTLDLDMFNAEVTEQQQAIRKSGYVPTARRDDSVNKKQKTSHDDKAQALSAAFDREVARGLGENEEIFTAEEDVVTKNRHLWAEKYRPRKPQYFNRVSLGFEWNKYNQTHYDQDNPPPKVVQGYKFNIFYPDLVDKMKAPTYRIERENGRKRGESTAPAGEDDTCLIHFIAGPPYEDIAFRIVDKEWDYSAKMDRGFESSFNKGVLQLSFQFKKVYYRK